jgi:hypothetical protein
MFSPEKFPNRSFLHKIGMYLLMFVAFGGIGGALIYLTLMQFSGWPLVRSGGVFGSSSEGTSAKIVLYHSPTTEQFLTSVGGRYDTLIQPWREFAKASSIDITEVNDLGSLTPHTDDVLVLPSAVALSPQERSAIQAYQQAGGRLLLTWATGSRDGAGQWVGWDFLKDVAGVQVSAELPDSASNYAVLTQSEGPLTHDFSAGSLVGLAKTSERSLLFTGATLAAYAVEMAHPGEIKDTAQGILAYQETSRPTSSRVVVFGAAESTWVFNPTDMYRLLTGSLSWLVRQPAVFKSNWPNGLGTAYMVAVDASASLGNAWHLSEVFMSNGYDGSFFVPLAQVPNHHAVLSRLGGQTDIGYRCDDSPPYKSQSIDQQRQRVQAMVSGLASLTQPGQALSVFDCPAERTDALTTQALYEAGVYSHLAVQSDGAVGLPLFAAVPKEQPGRRFVVLPSHADDDFSNIIRSPQDRAQVADALARHFDAARTRGGLAIARYSLGDSSDPANDALFSAFLSNIKNQSRKVWLTNGREISKWWNERERFQIRVRPSGAKVELDVSVIGDAPFSGGALVVVLPNKDLLPKMRGLKNNMPGVAVERLDDYRALVRFGTLNPGNYSYQLSY